jgi:hypothetical protein
MDGHPRGPGVRLGFALRAVAEVYGSADAEKKFV